MLYYNTMNIYQKFKNFKFQFEHLDVNRLKDKLPTAYQYTQQENVLGIDFLEDKKNHYSLFCDFLSHKMQQRFEDAFHNKSQLIKAFGKSIINKRDLTILDATTGFGYDALEMSVKAKKVIMLEQSPIIYSLLQDGLIRLKDSIITEEQILSNTNVELECFNKSFQAFYNDNQSILEDIDIIYLDPMYPKENKKSAQNKKYMQYLQDLTQNSIQDTELLDLALKVAKLKVIMKRPIHAEIIYPKKLCYQVKSKLVRYDVYLP